MQSVTVNGLFANMSEPSLPKQGSNLLDAKQVGLAPRKYQLGVIVWSGVVQTTPITKENVYFRVIRAWFVPDEARFLLLAKSPIGIQIWLSHKAIAFSKINSKFPLKIMLLFNFLCTLEVVHNVTSTNPVLSGVNTDELQLIQTTLVS